MQKKSRGIPPCPISGAIGQRILLAAGTMKQNDLAGKTDVTASMLSRYLRGQVPPPVTWLLKVAEVLKLNTSWMLLGEGPMRRGEVDIEALPFGTINAEYSRRLSRVMECLDETMRGKEQGHEQT